MNTNSDTFYYATLVIFALISCIYIPILVHYDRKEILLPLKVPVLCALGFGFSEIALAMIMIRKSYLMIIAGFLPIVCIFSLGIFAFAIIGRNIQKKRGYRNPKDFEKDALGKGD